jgi:hypothetical protein
MGQETFECEECEGEEDGVDLNLMGCDVMFLMRFDATHRLDIGYVIN